MQNAEKSSRGYYEQAVPALLPCSVFKWEVVAAQDNFSLFSEYLFTEPDMEQFQFELTNLVTDIKDGSVGLSWTLTQPCVDEYQIQVCSHTNTHCWQATSPGLRLRLTRTLTLILIWSCWMGSALSLLIVRDTS